MSGSSPSQLDHLRDYAKQLKRHTKGRCAVHIHISRLLKHHQEATFRREASAFIKHLMDKFDGSRNFAISNNDLVMVTSGAKLDDIEPTLVNIRKLFKDDPLIASLDPVQGKSDNFTTCYDLKKDFQKFIESIDVMVKAEKADAPLTESVEIPEKAIKKPVKSNMADASYSRQLKPKHKMQAVKIERTDAHTEVPKVDLDGEIILKLEKFINVLDISAHVSSKNIIAIVGKGQPTPAMIERSAKVKDVVSQLIDEVDLASNLWLKGYLDDLVAQRLMVSEPELKNKNSLASIVPLTINSILGAHFDTFKKGHKSIDKSAIIIELSLMDVLQDSVRYEKAQNKVRKAGYKLAIGQVDPFALTILDPSGLDVDFFKIRWQSSVKSWLKGDNPDKFKSAIQRIGLHRVIISGCDTDAAITTMRKHGAILFEGSAVDGYKPK